MATHDEALIPRPVHTPVQGACLHLRRVIFCRALVNFHRALLAHKLLRARVAVLGHHRTALHTFLIQDNLRPCAGRLRCV